MLMILLVMFLCDVPFPVGSWTATPWIFSKGAARESFDVLLQTGSGLSFFCPVGCPCLATLDFPLHAWIFRLICGLAPAFGWFGLCVLLWTFVGFGSRLSPDLSDWQGAKCKHPRPWKSPPIGIGSRVFLFAMVLVCRADLGRAMPIVPGSAAERKRVSARVDSNLAPTRALRRQTQDKRNLYLVGFKSWLWEEKGVSFKFLFEQKPADPERVSALLIEYGRQLYYAGKAYGIYAETMNAVACSRPLIKHSLTAAWDLAFCWLADEPYDHHPAMLLTVMAAMSVVSLTWGWPHFTAVLLIGWAGVMRIGEVLAASRRELVLPGDRAPGTSFALVMVKMPKTLGRAAKHQAARIDQIDIVNFLSAMYAEAAGDTKIWPYSAATLRKRFSEVRLALKLPIERVGDQKPFALGSLRPGGATWLLHKTENAEVVRRRGRWLSVKTLEIYLQEARVSTYLERARPAAKVLIEFCSGGFATTLDRRIDFLQCGVPSTTWFYLLRDTAEFPPKRFEKPGYDGDMPPPSNNDGWRKKNFQKHSGKTEGRKSFIYVCSVCIHIYIYIYII